MYRLSQLLLMRISLSKMGLGRLCHEAPRTDQSG